MQTPSSPRKSVHLAVICIKSRHTNDMVYVGTYVPTGLSHPRQVSFTRSMLLLLSSTAQAIASPQLLVGLKILFSYSCGVPLNGVWTNSLCSLTYLVASLSGTAFDILGLKASGISCPLPLFVLVAPFRWSLLLPLHCRFVLVWEVVCVLFLLG